jgi:ferredoxin-NADP reductase
MRIFKKLNEKYTIISASKNIDFEKANDKTGQYSLIKCISDITEIQQYCAIVNDIDSNTVELLLDTTSQFAKQVDENSSLFCNQPQGGFDISDVKDRKIVCFAGGSGIAGIIPIVRAAIDGGAKFVDVVYLESDKNSDISKFYHELQQVHVKIHFGETEGVLSGNEDTPILGMLTQLTGCQPIIFMNNPLVFACGPKRLLDRLRSALVPIYVNENDFRLNF